MQSDPKPGRHVIMTTVPSVRDIVGGSRTIDDEVLLTLKNGLEVFKVRVHIQQITDIKDRGDRISCRYVGFISGSKGEISVFGTLNSTGQGAILDVLSLSIG